MKYEFAALTDVGRMRQNNEDSVAYTIETGVAVLADGMGGYNAGEVASGMATAIRNKSVVGRRQSGRPAAAERAEPKG